MKKKRIFTTLSEKEEQAIIDNCKCIQVKRGEILVKKGERTNAMYIVKSGTLHVIDEKPGQRVFLASLTQSEIFGEMAFLDEGPRSATVVAATDSEVYRFTKEDFIRLIVENPQAGARFLITIGQLLVDRLRRTDGALSSLSQSGGKVDDQTLKTVLESLKDYKMD